MGFRSVPCRNCTPCPADVKNLRILFLPGLGGDQRMFQPLGDALAAQGAPASPVGPVYPPLLPEEQRLSEYAARLFQAQRFDRSTFDMAIGVSFGGLLLQEWIAANKVRCRVLGLASTAWSGAGLTRIASTGASLVAAMPPRFCRPALDLLAAIYPIARPRLARRHVYAAMARDADASLFFGAGRLVKRWPGQPGLLHQEGTIIQMHGTADPLFDFAYTRLYRTPEIVIAGGDHLVFARHADLLARRLLLAL